MANEHNVHLVLTGTVTFFSKILQKLCVAFCGCGYTAFKIFSKLIIYNKQTVKALVFKSNAYLFIDFSNIKPDKWIECAACC